MRIFPLGQVAAGAVAWRTGGTLSATLVVKATFTLVPRADMIATEPDEVVRAEVHHDDNPTRSIRLSSDLAPYQPQLDVLLTGHACAPAGKPAAIVPVRLAVYRGQAIVDKTLEVYGARREGAPQPFVRMALDYEHAFGGLGVNANPLGVGWKGGKRVEPAVHNLVDPGDPWGTVGFGPIARAWPERRRILGTHPRRELDKPVAEIPAGFDFAYFQAAPLDQRGAYLEGGEWLILEGVHPDLPQIKTRFPEARAAVRIEGLPVAAPPVELVADTLRVDADALRCSVTWRGSLALADEGWLAAIRVVAAVELPGRPIVWPAEAPAASRAPTISFTDDDHADRSDRSATMVIAPAADDDQLPTGVLAGAPASPPSESPYQSTVALTGDAARRAAERPGLPFVAPPAPPEPPKPPPQASLKPRTTLGQQLAVGREALPPTPQTPAGSATQPSPPLLAAPKVDTSLAAPRDVPPRASDGIPVINRTALFAFAMPCQVLPGQPARAVIVKGTFDLVPGETARLREETELPTGDRHAGDDLGRSVTYPSDFAAFKPRADVTLTGHAIAPGGGAPAAQVRFRFGRGKNAFDRRIAVFGERTWEGIVKTPSAPKRFERVALVHENAFGGPGFPKNPVGLGHAGATRPPLLEDPSHLVTSPDDTPDPVGFGAVPMTWSARARLSGTYGDEWRRARWPHFPDDFDWGFFQAAPAAQQLEHLQGDEPFEISGMDRQRPVIDGKLPRLRPRAFAQATTAAGGGFHEVGLRLDTATFDVDEMKLTLVWRGLLAVVGDDAADLAELFLAVEPLSDPRMTLGEAQARYEAQRRRLPPVGDDPRAPLPANQPPQRDALSAHEQRIRDRLRAEGILETTVVEAPPALAPVPAPPPRDVDPLRRRVEALLAAGAPLDRLDLGGADLSDLDFSRRSLDGTILQGANLRRCRFAGANLRGAQMGGADLTDADLAGATLTLADLTQAVLDGSVLDGAELTLAVLQGAAGERASFQRARGQGSRFGGGTWRGARFHRAELAGADFTGATLDEAVFDGAVLPDVRLYDARGTKVSFKDARLPDARADGVSLVQSTLRGAIAPSSIWDGAALDDVSFVGADLAGASFVKASARRALFSGADLQEARLGRGTFAGASFLKANLMGAQLEGADLSGADLRASNLHGAETWKADLRGADLEQALVTQTKLAGGQKPGAGAGDPRSRP